MFKFMSRGRAVAGILAALAVLAPTALIAAPANASAYTCVSATRTISKTYTQANFADGHDIILIETIGYRHCSDNYRHRDSVRWVKGRYNIVGTYYNCDQALGTFRGVKFNFFNDPVMGGNNPPTFFVPCQNDTVNSRTYWIDSPTSVNALNHPNYERVKAEFITKSGNSTVNARTLHVG